MGASPHCRLILIPAAGRAHRTQENQQEDMARAPFSIEWLSQSSRSPPAPGCPAVPSAPGGYPASHGTPASGGHPGLKGLTPPQRAAYQGDARLTPTSSTLGGVDSGYESEAGRSDCVSPPQDKDSRLCPSVGAIQEENSTAHTSDLGHTRLHPSDCASHEDLRLCPEDYAPLPEEEERSLYAEDCNGDEDSGLYPEDCGVPEREDCGPQQKGEDGDLYPADYAAHQDDDGRLGRRIRTAFSSEQIGALEKTFKRQKYLSAQERRKLATRLQLSEVQLKTWFQNRRMKLKRQLQDMQPEPFATAPFFNPLAYGQPAYPAFFQYAPHAAAGMAYASPGYPLSPYTGFVPSHPAMPNPQMYSEAAAFAYY